MNPDTELITKATNVFEKACRLDALLTGNKMLIGYPETIDNLKGLEANNDRIAEILFEISEIIDTEETTNV